MPLMIKKQENTLMKEKGDKMEIVGVIVFALVALTALGAVIWYDNYTNKGKREREAKKDNAIIKLCEILTSIYSDENKEKGENNND